ncbi:MAG: serine hydrolase [Hyphomonadaceae bacterium]|nr:serine hydrolase [Hyphomonadaceae bacterium]
MSSIFLPRRAIIQAGLAFGLSGCASAVATNNNPLAALQTRAGGRLGVHIMVPETGRQTGRQIGLNSDERFGMASTFKMLLAAIILRRADAG